VHLLVNVKHLGQYLVKYAKSQRMLHGTSGLFSVTAVRVGTRSFVDPLHSASVLTANRYGRHRNHSFLF